MDTDKYMASDFAYPLNVSALEQERGTLVHPPMVMFITSRSLH